MIGVGQPGKKRTNFDSVTLSWIEVFWVLKRLKQWTFSSRYDELWVKMITLSLTSIAKLSHPFHICQIRIRWSWNSAQMISMRFRFQLGLI
jgi:hypothetical protein